MFKNVLRLEEKIDYFNKKFERQKQEQQQSQNSQNSQKNGMAPQYFKHSDHKHSRRSYSQLRGGRDQQPHDQKENYQSLY